MKLNLKIWILFLFIGLSSQLSIYAQCQLCYLTEAQAQTTVNYLNTKNEMILYTGCANNDLARYIKISEISYRPSQDSPGYFEVYAKGTTYFTFYIQNQKPVNYAETNMKFEGVIDIAYVHVRTGGYTDTLTKTSVWDATCLGIYLGYDCDPCIDPFDYPDVSRNK